MVILKHATRISTRTKWLKRLIFGSVFYTYSRVLFTYGCLFYLQWVSWKQNRPNPISSGQGEPIPGQGYPLVKKTKPIFRCKHKRPNRMSTVSKKTKPICRKQPRPTVSKEDLTASKKSAYLFFSGTARFVGCPATREVGSQQALMVCTGEPSSELLIVPPSSRCTVAALAPSVPGIVEA